MPGFEKSRRRDYGIAIRPRLPFTDRMILAEVGACLLPGLKPPTSLRTLMDELKLVPFKDRSNRALLMLYMLWVRSGMVTGLEAWGCAWGLAW